MNFFPEFFMSIEFQEIWMYAIIYIQKLFIEMLKPFSVIFAFGLKPLLTLVNVIVLLNYSERVYNFSILS